MCALPGELVLSDIHQEVYHPVWSSDKSKTVLSRFYFVINLDDQSEEEEKRACGSQLDEDGDLIISRRQKKKTTEVITIEHMMSTEVSRVGLQVWMASFLLCDFIISNASLFIGQNILELGSGTGISSILLASMDVAGVLCTDTGNDILMQCHTNVSHNGHMTRRQNESASEAPSKVIVRELDWTRDSLDQDSQNTFHWRKSDIELLRKVIVIVAADVVYDNNLTDAFFKTLTKLMKDYNIRWAFLALEKRINFSLDELDVSSFAHDHFLDRLEILKKTEEGFDCQQMETSFPKCFNYTRTKELEILQRLHHALLKTAEDNGLLF